MSGSQDGTGTDDRSSTEVESGAALEGDLLANGIKYYQNIRNFYPALFATQHILLLD